MSTHKRASMREGPLAALFRKTEEDEPSAAGEEQAPHPSLDTTPDGPDAHDAPGGPSAGPSAAPASGDASSRDPGSRQMPAPKDRLKQAFSAEIPASLMDREERL